MAETASVVATKVLHSEASMDTAAEPATTSTASHRRGLSGNLFSKLAFLRPTGDGRDPAPKFLQADGALDGAAAAIASRNDGNSERDNGSPTQGTGLLQPPRTRSRKGSLRKMALLGKKLDGNTKKNLELDTAVAGTGGSGMGSVGKVDADVDGTTTSPTPRSPDSDDYLTPQPFSIASKMNGGHLSGSQSKQSSQDQKATADSDDTLSIVGISRKSTLGDMSTTEDDDGAMFVGTGSLNRNVNLMKPTVDSYFPHETTSTALKRRLSTKLKKTPLTPVPLEPALPVEEWDYAETAWWGWAILVMTWIVFVVGMGSCFETWSWAWDVGQTPYAPPELEDDPTLPIVGYYPALIILTGVMAWVWVVVAWVGMKYFKHARIPGDET